MGLVDGDIVTKRALCYGMLLPSGNDAAGATAVKLAGSYAAFCRADEPEGSGTRHDSEPILSRLLVCTMRSTTQLPMIWHC